MNQESEKSSSRRPTHLTVLSLVSVAAAIALANLSSEAVTGDLIKRIASGPERAYGWPLKWYWRVAETVPGTITPWIGSAPRPLLQWPVARFSATGLFANLAIWLTMLAGWAAASHRLVLRYRLCIRWRLRKTTVIVLLAVAAPIVIANMSFEMSALSQPSLAQGAPFKASFGWPLLWNWYIVAPNDNVYGWDFNAVHLAGNVLIWLGTSALATFAWEWLLRHYRPRIRFSLRTMLAAVALVALLCAWANAIWKRAEAQDALLASGLHASDLWVQRQGPKWLGLVAPDRFRRRVVGVSVHVGHPLSLGNEEMDADDEDNLQDGDEQDSQVKDEGLDAFSEVSEEDEDWQEEDLLRRLGRLPALRFLDIECGLLTPAMTDALRDLRQLRTLDLRTTLPYGSQAKPVNLTWVGSLQQLEHISLSGVHSDDLACLREVTQLKSLTVDLSDCEGDASETRKRLAAIGKLTQLRRVRLYGFPGAQIGRLGSLANLRFLKVHFDHYGGGEQRNHEFYAALGNLTQIESLELGGREGLKMYPVDIARLRGITNLGSLRLHISTTYPKACLAAIGTLTELRQLWLEGDIVSAGLAELAPLESLEEITSDNRMATVASLESLTKLKRLKDVCICGLDLDLASSTEEAEKLRRTLHSLQRAHPGIVVDDEYNSRWMDNAKEEYPAWDWEPFNDNASDLDYYLGTVVVGP